MDIYVGNLSPGTTETYLCQSSEEFGEVTRVKIMIDKVDGRSKGFGFIEMPSKEHTRADIIGLNGKDLNGLAMVVGEASNDRASR